MAKGTNYKVKTTFTVDDKLTGALRKLIGDFDKFSKRTKMAGISTDKTFKRMNRTMRMFGKSQKEITRNQKEITRNQKRISDVYSKSASTVKNSMDTVRNSTSKATNSFRMYKSVLLGVLTSTAIHRGISLMTSLASNSISEFTEFTLALRSAVARVPGLDLLNTDDISRYERELKKLFIEVGGTTPFTAIEAAKSGQFLARMGISPGAIEIMLPKMVRTAVALGESLDDTTRMIIQSKHALGFTSEDPTQLRTDIARVTDVIAKGTNTTSLTLSGLHQSFKQVGALSAEHGDAMEDVVALLAGLSRIGIESGQAGRTLKSIYYRPHMGLSSAEEAYDLLRINPEIDLQEVRGGVKQWKHAVDILELIATKLDKLSKPEQTRVLGLLFGQRFVGGAAALTRMVQGGYIQKLAKALKDSQGYVDDLYNVLLPVYYYDVKLLKSAVSRNIMEQLLTNEEGIRAGISGVTKSVSTLNTDFISALIKAILKGASFILDNLDVVWMTIKAAAAILFVKVSASIVRGIMALVSAISVEGLLAASLRSPFKILSVLAAVFVLFRSLGRFISNLHSKVKGTIEGLKQLAAVFSVMSRIISAVPFLSKDTTPLGSPEHKHDSPIVKALTRFKDWFNETSEYDERMRGIFGGDSKDIGIKPISRPPFDTRPNRFDPLQRPDNILDDKIAASAVSETMVVINIALPDGGKVSTEHTIVGSDEVNVDLSGAN